jgi:hypothetical protein
MGPTSKGSDRISLLLYVRFVNGSFLRNASYTMVFNALDYTALVVPVSKVDQELDKVKPPHNFKSKADKENYEACMQLSCKLGYTHR